MQSSPNHIPKILYYACTASSSISLLISFYSIVRQLKSYRKPQEQRMIIRILLMVPIFCITCWLSACLLPTNVSKIWLSPIQELYESFIIYTFFSFLVLILGGERKILMELGWGKPLIRHPLLGRFLPPVDIADPKDFLSIKRGVLQYVWFKPFYIAGKLLVDLTPRDEITKQPPVWCLRLETVLLIGYNISTSLSLYDLALFWRCLYTELAKYKPWPKFLCVKLIIFASYWQGVLLLILNHYGIFTENENGQDMGFIYQNSLLCIEMIGFSLGHLIAFSSEPYSFRKLPTCSRIKFFYALKDCCGVGDLISDFKTTFFGTQYNYRNFDSAEAVLTSNAHVRTRNARLNEGLRFSNNGTHQYWLQQPVNYGSIDAAGSDAASVLATMSNDNAAPIEQPSSPRRTLTECDHIDSEPWTELLDKVSTRYIPEDPNYPVVWDIRGHRYKPEMQKLKRASEPVNDV